MSETDLHLGAPYTITRVFDDGEVVRKVAFTSEQIEASRAEAAEDTYPRTCLFFMVFDNHNEEVLEHTHFAA